MVTDSSVGTPYILRSSQSTFESDRGIYLDSTLVPCRTNQLVDAAKIHDSRQTSFIPDDPLRASGVTW